MEDWMLVTESGFCWFAWQIGDKKRKKRRNK